MRDIIDELSKYLDHDSNGKTMPTLLDQYKTIPKDLTIKSAIYGYFNTLIFDINLTIDTLSNYVVIKILFGDIWEELRPLTPSELNTFYELVVDKIYYSHYD